VSTVVLIAQIVFLLECEQTHRHTKLQMTLITLPTHRQMPAGTTRNPKVLWEEPQCHPSQQRMDSPTACSSCIMPTADEPNTQPLVRHIQTALPHSLFLRYTALSNSPSKICPFPLGIPTNIQVKSSLGPPDPPPKWHNWRPRNFYCYYLCAINWFELVYGVWSLWSSDTSMPGYIGP